MSAAQPESMLASAQGRQQAASTAHSCKACKHTLAAAQPTHLHGLAGRLLELQQLLVLGIYPLKVLLILNLELLKVHQVQHLQAATDDCIASSPHRRQLP
jgi:hypothetical protein